MANVRELRPLGDALGTEAFGVNLSNPLDDETFAWIAAAFAEHPVLVFRDQNLSAAELAVFGRRFGVHRKHALIKYRHRDREEVSWLTNIEPDGKIDWYGVKRATDWHTDSTYEPDLPLLAILHAKEVPMEKGGTMVCRHARGLRRPAVSDERAARGPHRLAWPQLWPGWRASLWRRQGCDGKRLRRSAVAGHRAPPSHRSTSSVRQSDTHARL